MRVSIVIPNWNGKELLKKNLPNILEANPNEVIVVDDGSTDDSVDFLRQTFPSIKVIVNPKNLGFVPSTNKGVVNSSNPVVVLLNNDVLVDKNFLKPLLPHFESDDIFAVSCAEKGYSWAWAKFKNGFITHGMGEPTITPHPSFWASGGSAAFSREKWLKLGGMDAIYKPFYWEDVDISFRAQKRGWKIIWEPKSVVYHQHESTIGKNFNKNYIDLISGRNRLLFIWKNITSKTLFKQHQMELLKLLSSGKNVRPFLSALFYLPKLIARREIEKKESKLTDEQIFDQFTS